MKIHFKAALLGSYVSLSSLLPTAFATTPTPPVTIEATNDALQGSLINGVQLPYVINLKQSDEVKTIGIQATLAPYDPKSFATQKQVVFKQALDRKDQSFEKLTIPLMFKDPSVYELTIHIDGNGNTQSQATGGYEQFGREVGNYVDRRYRELIGRDISPGGAVWNMAKGVR